jgi:hypothetical protein
MGKGNAYHGAMISKRGQKHTHIGGGMKYWILARINTTGPVPMVTGVNYYSEPNPTTSIAEPFWELAVIESSGHGHEGVIAEAKTHMKTWGHEWAIPWLEGDCKLQHSGR